MRWRVVSEETGEEIIINKNAGDSLMLSQNGRVLVEIGDNSRWLGGNYVVEVAFFADESGEWVYENCVFSMG